MNDDRIDHKDDRMIEHTLKWDKSPFGPWCWHSFRGEDWEVTAEPYLFGEQSDGPLGSYVIKVFVRRLEIPVVREDLDPANAIFILCAILQSVSGWPVLVRWVPNVEMIDFEERVVSVMLHMVGGGYVMALTTYEQVKPPLEARYGALRETHRAPTAEEVKTAAHVKAVMEGGV